MLVTAQFTEWRANGSIRPPSFCSVRPGRQARDVRRGHPCSRSGAAAMTGRAPAVAVVPKGSPTVLLEAHRRQLVCHEAASPAMKVSTVHRRPVNVPVRVGYLAVDDTSVADSSTTVSRPPPSSSSSRRAAMRCPGATTEPHDLFAIAIQFCNGTTSARRAHYSERGDPGHP